MTRRLLLIALVAACHHTAAAPAAPTPDTPVADEPTPTPPRHFQLDGQQLVLPGPFVFASGATLDEAASGDTLEHVLAFLEDKPDITMLRIEAHSTGDGSEDDVMDTGEYAWSVGAWLVAHGIACDRLVIASFGGTKPISTDPAANQRVEVYVAQLRGLAIGGMPEDGGALASVTACVEN
jgi:outer membrane protein OmpA-like peptidoglycan-associated protein